MKKFYGELKKLNGIKKFFLPFVLIYVMLFSFFTVVSADAGNTDAAAVNEYARIDFFGANNTGSVRINVASKLDKRVKVTIEKGDVKYTYDLKNDTTPEVYPLQLGNGEYTVKIWTEVVDSKYALTLSAKYIVNLNDSNAPFLNSNQYVNFSKDSKAVKIAAGLTDKYTDDIDKVTAIYDFVISSLVYDTDKANAAAKGQLNGYLPSIDTIVASGKGICFDYAAVFAAMLRSQGIPAKLVTGYVKPGNAYHAWNEFYIKDKGWFKINDMKFDGQKFERIDPTFDSTSKSSKKVIQFIGDGSNYSKFQEY